MLLLEYLKSLSDGELSEVNLGFNEDLGNTRSNDDKIVGYINRGLVDLHTRFPLKTHEVIIKQYPYIKTYHLDKKYAQTNVSSEERFKYIEDTEAVPFDDRVLKIDQVFTGNGCEVPINDANNCYSIFTPTHKTIQILCPKHPNIISVLYRAAPEPLTSVLTEEQHINLPLVYMNALTQYVLARIYTGKQDQNSMYKANQAEATYERMCQDLMKYGMSIDNNTSNHKLNQRGFV